MKLEERLVKRVQKDGLTPAQDLLHAPGLTIIPGARKESFPPNQVLYIQDNVYHVHLVLIQLKWDKFILAPVVAVLVNTVAKQD